MHKVQVLMSTYNGELYLEEQLNSLINQVGIELSILVRDDGSTDGTKDILRRWEALGLLSWYEGGNIKPTKSFFELIKNSREADYYAFCDQDDVWNKRKLVTACERLARYKTNEASLYFSSVCLVDKYLNPIQKENFDFASNLAKLWDKVLSKDKFNQKIRRPTFTEVLTGYNCAAGCTMVFNKRLLELIKCLIQSCDLRCQSYHDYYTYLVCLAVGGNIEYDSNSYIKYRQHENNTVGAGKKRIIEVIISRAKFWMKLILKYNNQKSRFVTINASYLLANLYTEIPDTNKIILRAFKNYTFSYTSKLYLISLLNAPKYKFYRKIQNTVKVVFDYY